MEIRRINAICYSQSTIDSSTRIEFKTCRKGNQLIYRFVFKINSEFITFVQKRTTFLNGQFFSVKVWYLIFLTNLTYATQRLLVILPQKKPNNPGPHTPWGWGCNFCSEQPRLGSVLIHVCLREIRNKYALITDSNHTNKEYLSSFGPDPPQVNLTSISKPYQSRRQISYLT